MRRAVAQARTAAGAMCAVAARLLTQVRVDEAAYLAALPPPVRPETGVTAPSLLPAMDAQITMYALQAANAECLAACASLSHCEAPAGMVRKLAELVRVADLMVAQYVDVKSLSTPQANNRGDGRWSAGRNNCASGPD